VTGFDNNSWEKKIIKINKALGVMERHKKSDPFFSKCFSDLTQFVADQRRS